MPVAYIPTFMHLYVYFRVVAPLSQNGCDKYSAELLPIISEKRWPIVDGERAHAYEGVSARKVLDESNFTLN
jgi:hypothetical protein